MIVPHKTLCYGDSTDPPDEAIPMCTLRNFPNQIEHCIEWARDKFSGYFTDRPANVRKFIEKTDSFLNEIEDDQEGRETVANL
jgi:ubiquitin-activating enzyme E1